MTRRRHTASAETVVAATAGLDNWKTWAGRRHGDDTFEYLDLVRGAKRKFRHTFWNSTPPPGSTCPVCFCVPTAAIEWHITSSCGHAVCIDCLQLYAASLVQDREHSGPLKCPVCPMPLRPKDAIVALAGNHDLVRQWDHKIRDQVLRALPSYRSCPKCHNNNNSSSLMMGGGGFVTPECLLPHHEKRETQAMRVLQLFLPMTSMGMVLLFLGYCKFIISHFPSLSVLADMLFMMLPIRIFYKMALHCQAFVACRARQALWEPIPVECPCCEDSFVLSAQNELSSEDPTTTNNSSDEQTSKWMQSHTRPCPSCSVPIVKSGGCNHMRCSHCRAQFCWACMRLRTRCRAYDCSNGGRNAVPLLPGGGIAMLEVDAAADINHPTLLDRLESLEQRGRGQRGAFTRRDAGIVVMCLLFRHSVPVQFVANVVGWAITMVFGSKLVLGVMWAYILMVTVSALRASWVREQVIREQEQARRYLRHQPTNRPQRQVVAPVLLTSNLHNWIRGFAAQHHLPEAQMRTAEQRLDEQMIRVALANSRREQ